MTDLKTKTTSSKFSKFEDELIRQGYSRFGTKLAEKMRNKTREQVKKRAQYLGVKYQSKGTGGMYR